jgi:hypothetical protein
MDGWQPLSRLVVKNWFAGANGSNTSRLHTTVFEGLVSIVAGAIAGSVSLIGFGLDSIIFAGSTASYWRRARVTS